jgi:glycosyltransferase involved in cell wall biosynthesis
MLSRVAVKKILIDATGIVTTPTGTGKYSYYLIEALLSVRQKQFHFTILHQSNLPKSHPFHSIQGNRAQFLPVKVPVVGPQRDLMLFNLRRKINQFELMHCLHTYLPCLGVQIPSVVTIHDLKFLRFPDFFDNPLKPLYYRWIIRRSVRQAQRIIAVSIATKNDLICLLGLSPNKITVVHEASTITPAHVTSDSEMPDIIADKPFLFFVGRNRRAKNISTMLTAYGILLKTLGEQCPYFVIAGPGFDTLRKKYVGEDRSKKVIFLGPVSDELLVTLYRHACALVYPSLYEGFGLPVLEAMSIGLPVITSNCSSLPEVAGNAAILVDPHDEKDIFRAMLSVVQDKSKRETLKQRGLLRAHEFSWEKAAQATLNVYREILSL